MATTRLSENSKHASRALCKFYTPVEIFTHKHAEGRYCKQTRLPFGAAIATVLAEIECCSPMAAESEHNMGQHTSGYLKLMGFEAWMELVDFHIARMLCGLTSEDIPDYLYRDAFDEGHIPHTVARRAIKAARQDFGY